MKITLNNFGELGMNDWKFIERWLLSKLKLSA